MYMGVLFRQATDILTTEQAPAHFSVCFRGNGPFDFTRRRGRFTRLLCLQVRSPRNQSLSKGASPSECSHSSSRGSYFTAPELGSDKLYE